MDVRAEMLKVGVIADSEWQILLPQRHLHSNEVSKPNGFMSVLAEGQKQHINLFNINFWASTQNNSLWAPTKSICASFPGKESHKEDHTNFIRGIFGSKGRSQIWLLFFLSLPLSASCSQAFETPGKLPCQR